MIQRSLISFGSLLFVFFSLVLCFSAFLSYPSHSQEARAASQLNSLPPSTSGSLNTYATHLFGAFSVDTPAEAAAAASDGMQYIIHYGSPLSATSSQGLALQKVGMKEY